MSLKKLEILAQNYLQSPSDQTKQNLEQEIAKLREATTNEIFSFLSFLAQNSEVDVFQYAIQTLLMNPRFKVTSSVSAKKCAPVLEVFLTNAPDEVANLCEFIVRNRSKHKDDQKLSDDLIRRMALATAGIVPALMQSVIEVDEIFGEKLFSARLGEIAPEVMKVFLDSPGRRTFEGKKKFIGEIFKQKGQVSPSSKATAIDIVLRIFHQQENKNALMELYKIFEQLEIIASHDSAAVAAILVCNSAEEDLDSLFESFARGSFSQALGQSRGDEVTLINMMRRIPQQKYCEQNHLKDFLLRLAVNPSLQKIMHDEVEDNFLRFAKARSEEARLMYKHFLADGKFFPADRRDALLENLSPAVLLDMYDAENLAEAEEFKELILRKLSSQEEVKKLFQYFAKHREKRTKICELLMELGFDYKINIAADPDLARVVDGQITENYPRNDIFLKFLTRTDESFLERSNEAALFMSYQFLSDEAKAEAAQKIRRYCEKYSAGILLQTARLLEFSDPNILQNMYDLRSAMPCKFDDEIFEELILFLKNYYRGADKIKFVEAILAMHQDHSATAKIRLQSDVVLMRHDEAELKLSRAQDVVFLIKVFPELITPQVIAQIAANQAMIASINQTLLYANSKFINRQTYNLFEQINAAVAPGGEKILLQELHSFQDLRHPKRLFEKTAKKSAPEVMESALFKFISPAQEAREFDEFYRILSEVERKNLEIFVLGDEEKAQIERYIEASKEEMQKRQDELKAKFADTDVTAQELQAKILELEEQQKAEPEKLEESSTDLDDEEVESEIVINLRKYRSQQRTLQITRQNLKRSIGEIAELIAGKDSPNLLESFAQIIGKKDGEEKAELLVHLPFMRKIYSEILEVAAAKGEEPASVESFVNNLLNRIQNTELVRANWSKFRRNSNNLCELASLCESKEEFYNIASAALGLITQPNCGANLAILLQSQLESKRYQHSDDVAYAVAMFKAALPFLNSGGDVIMAAENYEEVLQGNSNIYLPKNYFLKLIAEEKSDGTTLEDAEMVAKGLKVFEGINRRYNNPLSRVSAAQTAPLQGAAAAAVPGFY